MAVSDGDNGTMEDASKELTPQMQQDYGTSSGLDEKNVPAAGGGGGEEEEEEEARRKVKRRGSTAWRRRCRPGPEPDRKKRSGRAAPGTGTPRLLADQRLREVASCESRGTPNPPSAPSAIPWYPFSPGHRRPS